MNPYPRDTFASKTNSGTATGSISRLSEAETTLRLIATLPAPEGLEARVKTALHQSVHNAPQSRSLRHWPLTSRPDRPQLGWMQSTWVRTAAAAAIVFGVAGGGWEIYSHVQPAPQPNAPNAIVLPPRPAQGGFSSANAVRKPRTLDGTVLTRPLAAPANPDGVTGKKPANQSRKPVKSQKAEATKTGAP